MKGFIKILFTGFELPTWMYFFTIPSWGIVFIICGVSMELFPVAKNFFAGSFLFYISSTLIIWIFWLMPFCSRYLMGVISWLILGSSIVSASVTFLSMLFVNHISVIASILIISFCMAVSSALFLFINKQKEKLLADRVKVSIYVNAFIFTIALSISNMYSINITNYDQLPLPFKIDLSSLKAEGFTPRNLETYILSLLTFPFLASNALLRALLEWISYKSKKSDLKKKSV